MFICIFVFIGKCLFVCPFTVCTHSFYRIFRHSFLFLPSQLHRSSPSFHQNTSPKWLTPSFFNMHSWRHPGRAELLCMLTKMIHKYSTQGVPLWVAISSVKIHILRSAQNLVPCAIWNVPRLSFQSFFNRSTNLLILKNSCMKLYTLLLSRHK